MIPTEVPSDLDVREVSREELSGRWTILVDISSDFQGAAGAYAVVGFVFPSILIASVIFGWTDHNHAFWWLLLAAAIFIGCLAISLYSLVWYIWARKRERLIYGLLRKYDGEGDI